MDGGLDFCFYLGRILTDEILDDSLQARYFVSGQAAISGDRYNVGWVSLILEKDKKEQDKKKLGTSVAARTEEGIKKIKRNKKS